MTKAQNLKTGRYITQMSSRSDCRLQIYDCETGVVLGHFVDPQDAETIKEMLNNVRNDA